MAYFAPYIDASGIHMPTYEDRLSDLCEAYRNIFGVDAELNAARRSAFAKQLAKLGAEVFPSESNFLLVDFHLDMKAAGERLRSRGILVRSCASFGLPDSFWRLAVRTEAENTRLIHELEEILHVR